MFLKVWYLLMIITPDVVWALKSMELPELTHVNELGLGLVLFSEEA